ncbi:MAG: SlyX family protein [Bdellovibrionales bacterium]|nr:SlyX family protein [Bdellovibrionales bacterium]
MSDTDRITDLEIKLAHQDHLLEQLNDVIYQQQKKLDDVEKMLKLLHTKISNDNINQGDEKPPHY